MQFDRDALQGIGKVTSFGLTIAVSMFVFGMAGIWVDKHLHTMPVFTVILFLAGGGVSMAYGIIRFLK